jgi:hypothetical protein
MRLTVLFVRMIRKRTLIALLWMLGMHRHLYHEAIEYRSPCVTGVTS